MSRLFYDTTRGAVSQAWGDWVDSMTDWEWFMTGTFRDPTDKRFPNWTRIGWESARRGLLTWHNALTMNLDYTNPLWVACGEAQARGTPHWHMLVANVEGERRMDWVDWWFEHYGIARVVPYDRELGARFYLGKYVSKSMAQIEFSPGLYAQLRRT